MFINVCLGQSGRVEEALRLYAKVEELLMAKRQLEVSDKRCYWESRQYWERSNIDSIATVYVYWSVWNAHHDLCILA
jgi:hypothetical protein